MSVLQKKPEIVVFAGPNGSGKSTITELLKPFRIFKKQKEQTYYDECEDWFLEDIQILTEVKNMEKKDLN